MIRKNKVVRLAQAAAAAMIFSLDASAQAATAGPGAWSSAQTWGADSQHGGNLKGYFYWPSTQPIHPNGKRALVLVLHGCSQTASGDVISSSSDGGFNWKTVADQYGAVVLAPNATGNAGYSHCWDYYGTSHSRTAGHPGVLLDLVSRFKNDPQYAIDPNQVYVTGFSSGGAETIILGCLAPDVFAGIGAAAGPGLGTSSSQYGSVPSGYTSTTAKNNCNTLAGSNASYFATQIAGTEWGTSDTFVAQGFSTITSAAFRLIYGGTFTAQPNESITGGGTNTNYKDSQGRIRTHEISTSGLAHSFPAGSGGQNSNYVSSTKINYPQWLMAWWFANNLRATNDGGTTTTTIAGGTTTTAGATTTTTTVATGGCYISSNAAHVQAGRAHVTFGFAYANGSNAALGYNNAFVTSKIRNTGPNYYVIDYSCN